MSARRLRILAQHQPHHDNFFLIKAQISNCNKLLKCFSCGFMRSAKAPALPHLRLWGWWKTHDSGGQ